MATAVISKTKQGSLSIAALTMGDGTGAGLKVAMAAALDPRSTAEWPARGGQAGG